MMPWLWVVPVVDWRLGERFFTQVRVDRDDMLCIDNTPDAAGTLSRDYAAGVEVIGTGLNHGCARSWNLGARRAFDDGRPGVVLAAPSIEWGRAGGLDLVEALGAGADDGWSLFTSCGWHLVCWTAEAFTRVGWFDERIYPVYFEDDDWLRRVLLAGGGDRRHRLQEPCVVVDAEMGATNQAMPLPFVRSALDLGHLGAYYTAKWGGLPGSERFVTPFDGPVSVRWWPGNQRAGVLGAPAVEVER